MSTYQKKGEVFSINISREKGGKKYPVKEATIDANGIVGDGHSGNWHRQVSLLSYESIDDFNKKGKIHTAAGDFAENITTRRVDLGGLKIGDRLAIAKASDSKLQDWQKTENVPEMESSKKLKRANGTDSAVKKPAILLEVTQIGKECHSPCQIYYEVGSCIMPSEGIFCRVIKPGKITIGDSIYTIKE